MIDREWTATDVAEAAGVTPGQINMWIYRGHLAYSNPTRGTGNTRIFTDDQRRIAQWMGLLVRHGLSLDTAANLAPNLHHNGHATVGLLTITPRTPKELS